MIRKLCLAVLIAAAPMGAVAAESDKDGADKPDAEKMVCKRELATGSIMSRRTCHTKAEWKAIENQGKADLDRTREMERSRSLVEGNR